MTQLTPQLLFSEQSYVFAEESQLLAASLQKKQDCISSAELTKKKNKHIFWSLQIKGTTHQKKFLKNLVSVFKEKKCQNSHRGKTENFLHFLTLTL